MNTRATDALPREAADVGFASRIHWPFHLGAAADVLLGLDLLMAGGLMADWLVPGAGSVAGIPMPTVLHAIGGALFAVAAATVAFCWLDAGRKTLWAIVLLNEAWILGSALLIVFAQDALSGLGNATVLGLAVVLAVLTWFQARALRRGG